MTELGWSTVSAKPGSCAGVGGSRAAGVTPADQARFLTAAYRCLAADPFVGPAFWFGLQDVPGGGAGSGGGGYGLFRRGGRAKPSVRAFRAVASGVAPDPRCGGRVDRVAPRLAVANPVPGLRFADQVAIDARAVDPPGGAGMRRIELWADGRKIRSFRGGRALLEPWFGSRALGLGRHTITLRALDEGLNVAEAVIGVEKVRPGALPRVATSLTMRLRSVRGRTARVAGRLARPADARVPVSGRVYAVFQKRSGGRWKTAHRVSERADRPVRVTQRVSGAGRWRVFLEYKGFAPYARSRSRPVVFSAR